MKRQNLTPKAARKFKCTTDSKYKMPLAPNFRVDNETEQAVLKYAIDFPAHGKVRTSNELRKLGVFISPSGVRLIWLRNDLENFKKRLIALEK